MNEMQRIDELFAETQRAQRIIDGLALYRERLLTCRQESTQLMRARIRELADPARDDFDRAVMCAVNDLEQLLSLIKTLPSAPK